MLMGSPFATLTQNYSTLIYKNFEMNVELGEYYLGMEAACGILESSSQGHGAGKVEIYSIDLPPTTFLLTHLFSSLVLSCPVRSSVLC